MALSLEGVEILLGGSSLLLPFSLVVEPGEIANGDRISVERQPRS